MFYRGEALQDYPEKEAFHSQTISARTLILFHDIVESKYPNDITSWIQLVDWNVWLLYFALLLFSWLCLRCMASSISSLKDMMDYIQLAVGQGIQIERCLPFLLLLAYIPLSIGVWHFNLMLTAQMNTNIISVDRNDYIQSLEQGLKSKRYPCWGFGILICFNLVCFLK